MNRLGRLLGRHRFTGKVKVALPFFWLSVLFFSATAVDAAGALIQPISNRSIIGPSTVSSFWEWDEENEPDQICFVGLAPSGMPDAPYIALVADKDTSSWIPTWRLKLQSRWAVNGKNGDMLLTKLNFSKSDRIEASLSYHPDANILAVAINNQTTNTLLFADAFKVAATSEVLIPVAATMISGGPTLEEVQLFDGYHPLADTVEIGERQPNGEFLPLTTFDGSGTAAVRITSPVPSLGEYHIVLQSSSSVVGATNGIELAKISPVKEDNWVELPLQDLPRGPVTLSVEYVEGGKALVSHTSKLTLGKANIAYGFTEIDRINRLVTGLVEVKSTTPLPGVNLELKVQYSQFIWDPATLSYKAIHWEEEPLALEQPIEQLLGTAPTTFTVPMPSATGLWGVSLKGSASPQISTSISSAIEYFNNVPAPQDHWIAITDLATTQLHVFDPQVKNWNTPEALKWSWMPSKDLGYNVYEIGQWGGPSDVKLRSNAKWGGQWIATTASGLATVAAYPSGVKKWAEVVGTRDNMHSIELLPNGNVAIAASTGGWVRIYTSSQGVSSSTYTQYELKGAHGVLWDPKLDLLWAVGDYLLVGLRVKGADSQPELEKVIEKRLPSNWGHDLSPVYGDNDRLWVTTGSAVYQYIKSSGAWLSTYPGVGMISRDSVKAIGNQPSGQVVEARQKPGTLREWTTDTVDFYIPRETRTIQGSSFYKARVWCPDYQ